MSITIDQSTHVHITIEAPGAAPAPRTECREVYVDDRSTIADYMACSDGERVIVQAMRWRP